MEDWLRGAVAGGLARLLIAPMDVLKIRLQVQDYAGGAAQYPSVRAAVRTIAAEEGLFRGLWRGSVPGVALYASYAAVQFPLYERLPVESPFWRGAAASVGATLATYPLDTMRTRRAVGSAALGSLYHGLAATLLQVVPSMAVTFAVQDALHGALGAAGAGAVAGAVSKTVVMPVDVVRRRYQVMRSEGSLIRRPGRVQATQSVARNVLLLLQREGLRAAFAGWTVAVCKSAPATAITFSIYHALGGPPRAAN